MFEDKEIENFLEGRSDKKYVVAVEANNYTNKASLVIHNPETGKKNVEEKEFEPFLYMKDITRMGIPFYPNNSELKNRNLKKYGIKIKKLRIEDNYGHAVERLENGYKYLISTSSPYGFNSIVKFFQEGGLDIYEKKDSTKTLKLVPVENTDEVFVPVSSDMLFYNTVSEKYEIHFKDISNFDSTSLEITYTGDVENTDEDDDIFDYEDVDLTNETEFELKKTAKKRTTTTKKKEAKELRRFIHYNLFEDKLSNCIRVIFNINLLADEKVKVTYSRTNRKYFFTLKPDEQFLIQTGIRLFKGYDKYKDIHKFYFDIETTGLKPSVSRVFAIGCKDNKGWSNVKFVDKLDDDECELELILNFFHNLIKVNPSVILGYNSEDFDFYFLLERLKKLNFDVSTIKTSLNPKRPISKINSTLKVGGETKNFSKTNMWGFNVLDVLHAVWRAQAINSEIKEAKLKYIAKKNDVAKENRMYIEKGNEIYKMYSDNKNYIINSTTNKYELIPDEYQNKPKEYLKLNPDYDSLIKGSKIVEQYLIDDLEETEGVDNIYNESTFMLGKLLPVTFSRTATIGGASQWNLIMTAWSYENNLAIPYIPTKPDFTGGLSRTFKVGYLENIYKFDFSGLYPSIQLEKDVFPKHDVTNALKRLLLYFKLTRDKFKKLAKDESLPEDERNFYDVKQLPIKILNNSNFGANGSEFFNWADYGCAETITCSGRQFLRLMVDYIIKWGGTPAVEDTDGLNAVMPEYVQYDINFNKLSTPIKIEELKYELNGKTYTGVDAIIEKFNAEYLNSKYMKLDNDGMWVSGMNFSRKNYASMEFSSIDDKNIKKIITVPKKYLHNEQEYLNEYVNEKQYTPEQVKKIKIKPSKIKYTGNTIKSRTMSLYIEEFISEGIKLLLNNKPKEFVELYYEHLTRIYTRQVPLRKIAKKSKIKNTIEEYINRGVDKNGRLKARQSHMELIIKNNFDTTGLEFIYTVNNGKAKSHGDSDCDKDGNPYSYLISEEEFKTNPDKLGPYNVAKYVDNFNTRVEKLLSGFQPKVQKFLLKYDPTQREYFTDEELKLGAFDKDTLEEFFTLETKEVKFWNRNGKLPDEIFTGYSLYPQDTLTAREYFDKLKEVNQKLKNSGIDDNVKSINDSLVNNDLVLNFKYEYYIDDIMLEEYLHPYVNSGAMLPINHTPELSELFKEKYKGSLKENRRYYINEFIDGQLDVIKEVA